MGEKIHRILRFIAFLYLVAGLFLLLAPLRWFPTFYDVRYMGSASIVIALVISSSVRWFKPKPGTDPKRAAYQLRSGLIAQISLATILTINSLGDLGLYQIYLDGFGYDKIAHFFNPLLLTYALTGLLWSFKNYSIKKSVILAVIIIFLLSLGWEFLEWFLDAVFGTRLFGHYGESVIYDTIIDTIMNAGGVILGALFATKNLKKQRLA